MRILWAKTELLHPVDKGGKIRTFHMLRELKRVHHVTYVTLDDGHAAPDALERAAEYCQDVVRIPFRTPVKRSPGFYADLVRNLASPLPYAIAKYRSAAMRREIGARAAAGDVDVLVCDFLTPSVNIPDDPGCPAVLFQHNVEALIWKRHWELARDPLSRGYLRAQWRRMRTFEARECRRYDHVVVVSPEDRELVSRDYGVRAVSEVPTGVDTEYFRSHGKSPRDPHNMVFTGSMDWIPNEDAVRFCVHEILPLIRQVVPDATLTVVGRNPSPSLVALGGREPGVTVTGRVDDVRPYMERAALYLVPIRIGGGTRLKIFEAMAMGLPVVSTRVGAEGLPVADGQDIVLADSPAQFANAAIQLLTDPKRAQALGGAASRMVRERAGWDRAAAAFAAICERVAVDTYESVGRS
jgi:glycosyltransferase involved in cell wall biosynthesis